MPPVEPGLLRDVLTLILGVMTGVLSALFGVGGATISTPGIRLLGASALMSIGTTLPSIFPSAVSGTARYVREELVEWSVVRWTAPVGVAASIGGSIASRAVPGDGHWLMVLTAAMLGFSAWRMARPPAPAARAASVQDPEGAGAADASSEPSPPEADGGRHSPAILAGVGLAAGAMSGLLGVGGGVIMVPAFTELVRLPLKTAIATSLVCVASFAVPGTITHWALGGIDWRFALLLAVGVVPGARVGAALAIRTADLRLRRIVAGFLGVTAVVYAAGEIAAMVR